VMPPLQPSALLKATAATGAMKVEASVLPADARGLNDNAHGIDRLGYRASAPTFFMFWLLAPIVYSSLSLC